MTASAGPGNADQTIRITAEEASSSHVDDLLKRQASLRGEGGISRDRGRKWYYQNWFVFMIAGALAAFGAWALMEPYFDDFIYMHGPISELRLSGLQQVQRVLYSPQNELIQRLPRDPRFLTMKVGAQKVLLVAGITKWIEPDGKYRLVAPDDLRDGTNVGVYLKAEYLPDVQEWIGVAEFIEHARADSAAPSQTISSLAARNGAAALLLFPIVAAAVGFAVGAADGIVCRLFRRVLLVGTIGLFVGFIGGFISHFIANLVYTPLSHLAAAQEGSGYGHMTTFGFIVQMVGRGLAWCLAGMTMGLAQGIALRSKRLFLYGFVGGMLGGVLGGLLFDPIDLILLGGDKPSAHIARLVGFCVIGGTVGAMIGIVELLARDAWFRMLEGPLAGKEFLVFKDLMRMGSSPRSDIYLFNDPQVAPEHAILRATGDTYELENMSPQNPVRVNGRPTTRARLRHGDRISLGRTTFLFQRQRSD